MLRYTWFGTMLLLGLTASDSVADGKDDAPGPPTPAGWTAKSEGSSGWTFSVAPYLWGASLSGNASVGQIDADVDATFADILEQLNIGAMVLAEARYKRFGIFAHPFFIRTRSDNSGAIDTKVTNETTIIAGGVSYRVADFEIGELVEGQPVKIGIEPYAGVRWTHLRLEIKLKEGNIPIKGNLPQTDQSESWLDPIVGSRFFVNFTDRWILATAADVGGFSVGTDYSWNAQGYVGYRSSLFGVPTTYTVGYRALHQKYDSNNFDWDVTQQGPILGAVFKF